MSRPRGRLWRLARRVAGGIHRDLSGLHPLGRRLLFMHVPKVGGTAVEEAIEDFFRVDGSTRIVDADRLAATLTAGEEMEWWNARFHPACQAQLEAIVAYHLFRGDGWVHGHLTVSKAILERFADRYLYMTVLRHPVDRWISRYRWDKVRNTSPDRLPTRAYPGPLEQELRAFLASPRAREIGRAYVWHLGGIHADGDIGSPAAVALAKENLARFHVLGTTEDMAPLVDAFERYFGVRLDVRPENETAAVEKSRGVDYDVPGLFDAAVRAEIEALCAPDVEVWEHCRALVAERAAGRGFPPDPTDRRARAPTGVG